MVFNLLLLCWTLAVFCVNGELLPEHESSVVTLNPLMPNDEQSVKDCPYTYYQLSKQSLASSIFSSSFRDKSFAHVVKLDTVDEACLGAIVDAGHVLTTKSCALKQPRTISFHNGSLPRSGVRSTIYHLSVDVALLRLSSPLNFDEQITPACFWSASIKGGFPSWQHLNRDPHTGALASREITCHLSERRQCSELASRIEEGLLQIQAVSNYRTHPFIVLLGNGQNGTVVDVPTISNWIQQETGTSVDAIELIKCEIIGELKLADCALRYARFREYDNRVAVHRSSAYQSIQLQNGYLTSSMNNRHKVSIGFYLDDPLKEAVIVYGCYGTLVHGHYVLTAASCITDYENHTLIVRMNQITKLTPAGGAGFNTIEDSQYLDDVYVARVYLHPNFTRSPLKNDLALLLLDEAELSFQKDFKPACLWHYGKFKIREFQTNGHGPREVVEHYKSDTLQQSNDRRQTEFYVKSKILGEGCPLNLTTHQICVGDSVTIVPGTCEMNRGAAMSREIWVLERNIYDYVFAVGSVGENCGFNTPATYTKVAPYISWIDGIIFGENVKYNDSAVYYGDECNGVTGATGVCLELTECNGILNFLSKQKVENFSAISCGFENDTLLVCCSFNDFKLDNNFTATARELEDCPDLYVDFRKSRSPYQLRNGSATAVGLLKSEISNHKCDATMISKQFLITSATCYRRFQINDTVSYEIGSKHIQIIEIVDAFIHPKFIVRELTNNIAVLKLKEPITVNHETVPACLWSSHTHVPFLLEVVGRTAVNVSTYPLYRKSCDQRLDAPLLNSELCVAYDTFSTSSHSMPCNDAGTGVFNYFAHGLNELQISYLVGVFNRATGCGLESIGVFTRISQHFAWIKSIVYRNA